MRISDWSSDVCSSDLALLALGEPRRHQEGYGEENDRQHSRHSRHGRLEPDDAEQCSAEQEAAAFDGVLRAGENGNPAEERPLLLRRSEHLDGALRAHLGEVLRSEEHTSELQSLMRISYAVFCLKQK